MSQLTMFDGSKKFIIDKPIRLISLFSGYDSQLFSLKYLGADVKSWRTCEWAVKSIQALKDAHFKEDNKDYSQSWSDLEVFDYLYKRGISANYNEPMTFKQIERLGSAKARQIFNNIIATHNLVNIQQVHGEDLGIEETDKYCYVMTYSFPCQDLSSAGKGAGMEKGSGTRSGMLWEVERILEECKELPQVLLMENVPEVKGTKNIKHFAEWVKKLESLGYHCYWQVLNAKDYGVPQNRERCFMVSILGDYYYEFPQKIKLEHKLKDLLEDEVDERFYISDKIITYLEKKVVQGWKKDFITDKNYIASCICNPSRNQINDNWLKEPVICASRGRNPDNPSSRKSGEHTKQRIEVNLSGCSNTLTTVQKDNYVLEPKVIGGFGKIGTTGQFHQQNRIYEGDVTISLTTGFNPYYAVKNYRIRKLTPKECFRLMGVRDEDYEKIAKNQSNASLYHLAGDSIVIDVLMAIFKQMID